MRTFSALDAVAIAAAARYLSAWLSTVPPETLAEWIRRREDVAARIPPVFRLPDLPWTRTMVARYLRHSVDEDWYEALRLELGRTLPVHAAMLGLEGARSWYVAQLEAVRHRILAQLEATDHVAAR